MDPGSRPSATLLDTSAPVEDPRRPKEVEFQLSFMGPLEIHFKEGTYAQGGGQGSPFWTDRKRHLLCITPVYASEYAQHFEFAIDYGSICAIASDNGAASFIPWDLWKHKTTLLNEHAKSALALSLVGPRVLWISKKPYRGPLIRSLDFTPGACRFTKQIDTSFDDTPPYGIRRATLTDTFPEGHEVAWVLTEDNILAFTVSWWYKIGHSYSSVTRLQSRSLDKPRILEIWTF